MCNKSNYCEINLLNHRSVNEVICHGIPDMRPLENGDILNSMSLFFLFFFFHSIFMFVIGAYFNDCVILFAWKERYNYFILKIVVLNHWRTDLREWVYFCFGVMMPLFCLVALVDITIYYNGFHGDLNETFFVGEVDEESKQLVKVTYECISQAIAAGILYWKFYTTCIHNYFKWILLNMYDSMLRKSCSIAWGW